MKALPTPDEIASAAANAWDALIGGGIADMRPMRSSIIDEGPKRAVHRYWERPDAPQHGGPVLLVPPLAAPALCFDLRRGCSLVEYLLEAGRRVYLVDYGEIAFADRDLGLEDWIDDIIPSAIETVRKDADDTGSGARSASSRGDADDPQLIGWSLGGVMSLLVAADRRAPVRSVAMIGSPFDFTQVPLVAPLRPLADLTGGRIITAAYRVMGGAPRGLVRRAFQLSSIDKYVTKPVAILRNLDDRDFLAQIEAVDRFTANMFAYPGRTFGQLYHRLFRINDLADGTLELGDRTIRLDEVRQPVLSVAGEDDGIAPLGCVHHVGGLLPNARDVRLETAPGGHLGVLSGRKARRTTWPMLEGWLKEHDPRDRRDPSPPVPRPLQAA